MNDTTLVRFTFGSMAFIAILILFTGCAMYDASIVAIHDSIDAVKKCDKPTLPPVITNALPTTVKPEGCVCDLSKPLALFASPVHGTTEAQIREWLRARWVAGKRDSCDGLPKDVRPKAILPSGKAVSWKYGITDGKIPISFNGDTMTLGCGDVAVDGLTQRWHFVGTSTHEDKRGWLDAKPGVATPIDKWAWFEVRNK